MNNQAATNRVKLKISCYRYSSLVYLRNSRPVLWDLELSSTQELRNVKISVQHHPDYAAESEWKIGLLPAGKVYHCHGECPKFDEERLLSLKVEEPGRITVTVTDENGVYSDSVYIRNPNKLERTWKRFWLRAEEKILILCRERVIDRKLIVWRIFTKVPIILERVFG